jgi:hypothetical protein
MPADYTRHIAKNFKLKFKLPHFFTTTKISRSRNWDRPYVRINDSAVLASPLYSNFDASVQWHGRRAMTKDKSRHQRRAATNDKQRLTSIEGQATNNKQRTMNDKLW